MGESREREEEVFSPLPPQKRQPSEDGREREKKREWVERRGLNTQKEETLSSEPRRSRKGRVSCSCTNQVELVHKLRIENKPLENLGLYVLPAVALRISVLIYLAGKKGKIDIPVLTTKKGGKIRDQFLFHLEFIQTS